MSLVHGERHRWIKQISEINVEEKKITIKGSAKIEHELSNRVFILSG